MPGPLSFYFCLPLPGSLVIGPRQPPHNSYLVFLFLDPLPTISLLFSFPTMMIPRPAPTVLQSLRCTFRNRECFIVFFSFSMFLNQSGIPSQIRGLVEWDPCPLFPHLSRLLFQALWTPSFFFYYPNRRLATTSLPISSDNFPPIFFPFGRI